MPMEPKPYPESLRPSSLVRDAPWANPNGWNPKSPATVEVTRRAKGRWAVVLGGELLCLTVYRRGALAVKAVIERLAAP